MVTSRLTYVEAAAALAQAARMRRVRQRHHSAAVRLLDQLWSEFDVVDVDDPLARRAAALATDFTLRGYDAVHCASAEQIGDGDLVAASGDRRLLAAWRELGVATADTASADDEPD